jgi:hypothetical protein
LVVPSIATGCYDNIHRRSDLDAALSIKLTEVILDVSYAAPQAHGIVNVALHREYSLGIVFIFSQGRKDLYHV